MVEKDTLVHEIAMERIKLAVQTSATNQEIMEMYLDTAVELEKAFKEYLKTHPDFRYGTRGSW